jgi:hypothetical protein
VLDGLKAGAQPAALHAAAVEALGAPLHPVLAGSVGRRIGLSLDAGGALRPDTGRPVAAGDVYAVHVGARDDQGGAIASAVVAVGAKKTELLVGPG